ncbi:gamma-glutamyl-gamma-aminobutyrate hydrolase family protein [Terriglobus aquaticus]|uniref:Gamma-glutamyl-gamma-aminobutyrate hydrolase family protein n=1 Tax=Terriglobus aquaticus TaxID=940139 RepID=A0ABW9KG72_9BACT|nr:type 1 glutamine amidotransferase [Terriglobus aquaticus]
MRPTILIPSPTSFDPEYNQQCWPEYAAAVQQCGGTAVAVPLNATEPELLRLAEIAQGILLPGSGADVLPARYGHEAEPETNPADAERERVDMLLLELAERNQMPTLAVCFGLQSLNVYRGGTLVQHLQPVPVNHRAGRAVAEAHSSVVAAESHLGRILSAAQDVSPDAADGFLRLMVNSSHHQAVGVPGDGLRVSARSTQDGVIEAVEDPSHPFLVGVQWHPERTIDRSDASRHLVGALVAAAVRHG